MRGQASSFPLDLNCYEITEKIGKGATADVYMAKCLTNGRTIAIKIIDLESCPIEINKLHEEVAFWSSCKHPNIIEYYGSFVNGSCMYILMEYMSAGSCYEIIRFSAKSGIPSESVIAAILHEVVTALLNFHENRQMHRDIKAGNILINDSGQVKLCDFGIATSLLESGLRKRARYTVIGTPCYMAPEVLKETEGYTEKADIWSLGITAIELATGSAPYSNLFPLEVIVRIVHNPPPTLPDDSRFSSAFKDFVKQCLNQVPEKRPSAKDLLSHRFFKQSKDINFLTKQFIVSLPPLARRFEIVHQGSALQPPSDKQGERFTWVFDNPATPDAKDQQTMKRSGSSSELKADGSVVSHVGKFTITSQKLDEKASDAPDSETSDDDIESIAREREVAGLEKKILTLRQKNSDLKAENDKLKRTIFELGEEIRAKTKQGGSA